MRSPAVGNGKTAKFSCDTPTAIRDIWFEMAVASTAAPEHVRLRAEVKITSAQIGALPTCRGGAHRVEFPGAIARGLSDGATHLRAQDKNLRFTKKRKKFHDGICRSSLRSTTPVITTAFRVQVESSER